MSCVLVVAPLIIGGWPVITAAVTAAVGSLGFTLVKSAESCAVEGSIKNTAEIEVENSEVLQNAAATGEQLVIERAGVSVTFSRDRHGALKLCVEGEGHSKAELKKIGQEVLDRVTQQYVYHRVITELKDRNMAIVDEEVSQDRTVKIRVRNL